jgi:hypothetical protein
MNLPTLAALEAAVKAAIEVKESAVKEVQHVMGCTDYDDMLVESKPVIGGILKVKEFRITLDEDGKLLVLYKADSTKAGWFPKPLEEDNDDLKRWQDTFKHPDPSQGLLTHVSPPSPCLTKGRRHYWNYPLTYAGGCELTVPLKCISLPYVFPEVVALKEMIASGCRQRLDGDLSTPEYRGICLKNIKDLLVSRSCEGDIPQWNTVFNSIEESVGTSVNDHTSVLQRLVKNYGGVVHEREERREATYLNDEDVVQPITFVNGPIPNDAALQKIIATRATRLNLDYMTTNKALFPNRYVSE